jgi:ArsR family transcriptional regulator
MALPIAPQSDTCSDAGTEPLMPYPQATALADTLKAIADPTRVRLLDHLASVPGGTVCACHLPGQLGISQPTLSHHLKKLVAAGILTREQRGRWAHYTVVPAALEGVRAFITATGAPSDIPGAPRN